MRKGIYTMQARNGVGVPFTKDYAALVKERCSAFYALTHSSIHLRDENKKNSIIEHLAFMLLDEKIGSNMYDLMLNIVEYDKEKFIKNSIKPLENICSNIRLFDFAMYVRKMVCDPVLIRTGLQVLFTPIVSLVFACYGYGAVQCVDLEKKLVIFSEQATVVDYIIYSVVNYAVKFGSKLGDDFKITKNAISYGKLKGLNNNTIDLSKFLKASTSGVAYVQILNRFPNIIERNPMTSTELSKEYDCFIACLTAEALNVFNDRNGCLLVDRLETYYNQISRFGGERNRTKEEKCIRYLMFEEMNNEKNVDLLKHRRLYVRDKGVKIIPKNSELAIEYVTLREHHNNGEHLLFLSYKLDDIERFFFLNLADGSQLGAGMLLQADIEVCLFIMAWLGCLDEFTSSLDYDKIENGSSSSIDLEASAIVNLYALITAAKEDAKEDNLYYEEPVGWNYEHSNTKKCTAFGDSTPLILKEVEIGRYTRRLPANQTASDNAKALAAKYCMDLGNDKTFVESFTKKVKVGKRSKSE